MPLPKPPSSLDNSCSVIFDNTLYSYSPQGFLSLPLDEGAKWKKLDMGVSVTGATCVGTNPTDPANAALFVVGGTAASADYPGLQMYKFSTGKWTTITPSVPVDQNPVRQRLYHGSTYIQADDVILVYAGSQSGSTIASTSTFTIQASEPYTARSFSSSAAAAVSPIVMSWSIADAAMISGDPSDGKIYWFNPTAGWRDSGAGLSPPINKASGSVNAVLISGTDGSKNLYTFDLSQSPNSVTRTIVQDAAGNPIPNSAPIAARSLDAIQSSEKRDLTLSNWPSYNSTLAPTDTRQNFAMAQAVDGTVVFTGGNAQVPIAIFNADENGWADTAALLGDKKVSAQDVSSSTTKTKTTSSSRHTSTTHSTSTTRSFTTTTAPFTSATETAASSITDLSVPTIPTGSSIASADSGPSSNAILGITLGSIGGFLMLLGLILLLLRCRRRQQLHPETGKPKSPPVNEKSNAAFAQSTFAKSTFVKNTLPPQVQKQFRGHQHTASSESTSSMAILMGRVGQHKPRKLSNDSIKSMSVHKQFKSTISKPILQPQQAPILQIEDEKVDAFEATATELRPQNGLSGADDGTRRSSGWNKYWSGGSALNILGYGSAQGQAQGQAPAQASAQRNTVASERSSHYSQTPTTRNIRATQDSATVPPLNFEAPPGMNRVNTGSPVVSSYPNIPWKEGMTGTIERPISAVSALSATSSGYSSGIPESIQESWDPTHAGKSWGADRAPSSAYAPSIAVAQPHPLGVSKQPQLTTASTSNDMSWLNLGDNSRV
ncbi:pre-mrna splicing factor clf1 [Trichoderma arundinaceum]|uniref:Pre-mrna splicing factor clf1 n=1 Tax=Trichoderma arundinaceum TaxID=490622 RepID=A0A395NGE0_TRIAR|nr:pre-mrna splicing factor clf1 [Trichoderma arundinaceum]